MRKHEPNSLFGNANDSSKITPDFDLSGITPDEVRAEFSQPKGKLNLFTELQTANSTIAEASQMPDPEFLYPVLVTENEFTIAFADTGIGKTVFLVQIGNHIAQNGKRVLLVDLELTKKQFEKRYKDGEGNLFRFSENFFRVEYERLTESPKDIDYLDFFIQSLAERIDENQTKVVILDNLTKLAAGSTDNSKDTIPILEALGRLKREKGLTIIAIEHNKKVSPNRPIELNDLQGSKMKSNLCDSVFSIGRHNMDKNLRYVKQVKVRSAESVYDTENVLMCEITNRDGYLHFEPKGYGSEYEFIKEATKEDRDTNIQRAKALSSEGKSQRAIADELGISVGAVNKYLKL